MHEDSRVSNHDNEMTLHDDDHDIGMTPIGYSSTWHSRDTCYISDIDLSKVTMTVVTNVPHIRH